MPIKLAVVYYSATGSVHAMAEAVRQGAESVGAEVRLRRAPELAGEDAIDANPAWRTFVDATKFQVPEAELEDLAWADCYAFGTPTRLGSRPLRSSSSSTRPADCGSRARSSESP
jgi:NAD(P)H dehydrogenase (quinone)